MEFFFSLFKEKPPSFKARLKRDLNNLPSNTQEISYRREGNDWSVLFSFLPWIAPRADIRDLPSSSGRTPKMRSPERKPGFSDINRISSRVKSFGLKEAIVYSYWRDTRFVFVLCLLLGYSVWWFIAPEQLLHRPNVLSAPDLPLIVEAFKDTFINNVCAIHHLPSPCECGEPLNRATVDLFQEDQTFDPLGLLNKKER